MPIRKTVRTVTEAMRDAARARHSASDPKFRANVRKDRRATLREFETVEHALEDRERIEKATKRKKR